MISANGSFLGFARVAKCYLILGAIFRLRLLIDRNYKPRHLTTLSRATSRFGSQGSTGSPVAAKNSVKSIKFESRDTICLRA